MIIKKRYINLNLIICLFLLMIISLLSIRSSMLYLPSYLGNLSLKQANWYIVGFIMISIIFFIPVGNYKYSIYFYIFNIFLLTLLLIIGEPINGSKCWLIFPTIGSFQPSEFMKIALIISLSKTVSKWTIGLKKKISIKDEIKILIKVLIIILIPIILTFLEPDTGAIISYLVITISILLISPLRKRWFVYIGILLLILTGIFLYLYFFNKNLFINTFGTDLFYRIDRLFEWKNGTGMQLENSLTAIGSAGLIGHGYMKTPIYFPESGTDFIFSVFASNFGLIGSLIFIFILLYFDITIINISKKTKNITDKYIIIGTVGMLLYQQVQNIGMTLGILPITGITLPFISYGGSSLISYMLIIGIIFNISSNKKSNLLIA